jgi:hypothetical protein
MQLYPELKPVLEGIDFVNRYKAISEKYSFDSKESLEKYSIDEVIKIIESLGYTVKYVKSENFFKVLEKIPPYQFQFNIILKYGIVEFIWDVLRNGERLQLGGPWSLIKKLVTPDQDEIVILPVFRNYEDLKSILKEGFAMYEDFKSALNT